MTLSDLDAGWRRLSSAALVGSGRRPAPALPVLGVAPRPGASQEQLVLDAAALAGAARRAGQRPAVGQPLPAAAEPDEHEEAPARASQLLELVLSQPPGGTEGSGRLLEHWAAECARAGRRIPHRLLPAVLDAATGEPARTTVAAVVDRRGQWLAAQNPDWAWAVEQTRPAESVESVESVDSVEGLDPDAWARLRSAERLEVLALLRLQDPAAARALLLTTWDSDSAKDRRAHLAALRPGLGPDDEDLLESALDDRAAAVRDLAAELLDGLPTSRRARRMAARLAPLVRGSGLLRKAIEVELPDEPDAAAVRDGLGKAPAGRSQRGWWLQRMVAGAPYDVWGHPADQVVSRLVDTDAIAGLRQATALRRAPDWAQALLDRGADTGLDIELLTALPLRERTAWVAGRVAHTKRPGQIATMLQTLPPPWSPQLSALVVQRLKDDAQLGPWLGQLVPVLADGLHPDAVASLQAWRERARLEPALDRALGRLVQSHSIRRTITEAFQ